MQDNPTNDITEMLIKLMDGELDATEKQAAEKMLENDAGLAERYQYLLFAKQAIKSGGLKQHVHDIQNEYLSESRSWLVKPAKIIKPASFIKRFMRVAAVFFIAIAGYGIFQYGSTNTQNVFKDNFVSYQFPVNRSNVATDTIEALYNSGSYEKVITAVNAKKGKDQKDYFIAAQSYLQLGDAGAAVNAFNKIENINLETTEKYFVEETDYYLALAYIKAGDIEKAEQQLNKITSNKQHRFYNKAKSISHIKLFILDLKEK